MAGFGVRKIRGEERFRFAQRIRRLLFLALAAATSARAGTFSEFRQAHEGWASHDALGWYYWQPNYHIDGNEEASWIYHLNHGWLYLFPAEGSGWWFYDLEMGWWHSAPSLYPALYHNASNSYLGFRWEAQGRVFYHYADDRIVWIRADGFQSLPDFTDLVMAHLSTMVASPARLFPTVLQIEESSNALFAAQADYSLSKSPGYTAKAEAGIEGANVWSQAKLYEMLYRMDRRRGDGAFREAANARLNYFLRGSDSRHFRTPDTGLPLWGNHTYLKQNGRGGYDPYRLDKERLEHEINETFVSNVDLIPFLYANFPEETTEIIERIWRSHCRSDGMWDRHDTGVNHWSAAYANAGAVFMRIFMMMYDITGEKDYWSVHRAEKLRDFMWARGDANLGLVPLIAERRGADSYKDEVTTPSIPGVWIPALLNGYSITRDSLWSDQAGKLLDGYFQHAWDPTENQFWAAVFVSDGQPMKGTEDYNPGWSEVESRGTIVSGYLTVWGDKIIRNSLPIARGYLDAWQVTGDARYLEAPKEIATQVMADPYGARNAAQYAHAIELLRRLHQATGEAPYLECALLISEDAINELWVESSSILRGAPGAGYESGLGVEALCEVLVDLVEYVEEPSRQPGLVKHAVGALNSGIHSDDSRTGTGFIMYSAENVHTRFEGKGGLHPANSDHFVTVYHKSNNSFRLVLNDSTTHGFAIRPSDTLVAVVDFANGTVMSLEGSIEYLDTSNGTIRKGFSTGDLEFSSNETVELEAAFTVAGSYFTAD